MFDDLGGVIDRCVYELNYRAERLLSTTDGDGVPEWDLDFNPNAAIVLNDISGLIGGHFDSIVKALANFVDTGM